MSSFTLLTTLNLTLGGLVFLLGFIVFRENPGQRLNRVVALMLFFGGLGSVLAALSFLASGTRTGVNATAAPDLLQNMSYLWEFFFPALFLFASIFPEEREFARRKLAPWLPGFGTLVFAPHVFHFALVLLLSLWRPELTVNPQGPLKYFGSILGIARVFTGLFLWAHQALFSLVNLSFGIASMLLLFDSYRRARVHRLRQQLGVIAVGLSACLVIYSFATSIPALLTFIAPRMPRISEGWRSGLIIAALTLGPGSIAYSVVRYKFLDAKLLARRGILYALGSAALVGLYLLVVSRLRPLLGTLSVGQAQVVEPVILIVALVLFQPAIARLEALLDQVFLKDPADYRNVLRQLGRELQTTIDLDALLTRTVATLADTLLLRVAHIVARTGDGLAERTGAGPPLSLEALQRLETMMPRLAPRASSVRLSEDRVEGLSPEEQAWLVGQGVVLVVPLRWRDEFVGALLLGEKLTGIAWTSEDVTLVTSLGSQVSVSLQNALLLQDRVAVARFEEELNLARQIQRTSLLSEFPPVPRCDVHAIYTPSKAVGGDFYDVVPTPDGGHLIAIGDVSGKGMPAALLSAMLQAALRTQSGASGLCEILRNINTLLFNSTATHQFATFFLARLDGLKLTFSNAGHNWPVLMRSGGERVFLERGGTVLGILDSWPWEEDSVRLSPGDRVVFYTDGISEAMNVAGEQFGEQRLCEVVESIPRERGAREVADTVLGEVHRFLDGVEPQDDITLLVIRVLEPAPAPPDARPAPETVAAI